MKLDYTFIKNKNWLQHTLQAIWGLGLMEKLVLYLEDLANPKIGLNLVPNYL
jgi:hypothetical protein